MIKSQFGVVYLTKPNYELAKTLNVPSSVAETVTRAGLRADLIAILNALIERYGLNPALDMWYDAVKVYAESQKGEL